MSVRCRTTLLAVLAFLTLVATLQVGAQVVPDRGNSAVGQKVFNHPGFEIRNGFQRSGQLPAQAADQARQRLQALGVAENNGFLDRRTGRFGTLIPPGLALGGGNAENGLRGFLSAHAAALDIDPAEVGNLRSRETNGLSQIHGQRYVDGIKVRDSYITASVKQGQLVLFGATNWGDVKVSRRPTLSQEQAREIGAGFLAADGVTWPKAHLELIPLANGQSPNDNAVGQGLTHRLAWVFNPQVPGDLGSYELLVDAQSGEILALQDTNAYATPRQVEGGVLPISNDGVAPDGIELPNFPMPFADVAHASGSFTTDSGGQLLSCLDGNVTSTLCSDFICMADQCGSISLTSAGDIDFGTSGGTDCTTPGFGGPGNTHASRSGFYELNRVKEQARGQIPDNTWLADQLTSNMNINSTCNAFWNGSTVNFYRSGGGCNNTGEIAGVFVHEWGHGMDNNDVNPSISNPGEGIADVYTHLRLDRSCIGRNFRQTGTCGGYGDPCTECSGVRDIDFAKRASGQPHDVAFADSACGSGGSTPCGGSTHCEGATYAEAVFDLNKRDLPAAGFDSNTAHEIATRLTYLGAGPVGNWFQCVIGFGGCNADGGYLNYLAADDDDGDLTNGTPHMQAIFNAFNRHGIACDSPTVQNSSCASLPATAPNVTATPIDRGVQLSWGAVSGASKYAVFRTDDVTSCSFGKAKVGETSGTSFVDSGLKNGHAYSYVVIPVGSADTCMGPSSACTSVVPAAGANVAIDATSASVVFTAGDGDEFIDNCETATVSFDVLNVGAGGATNVRIVSIEAVSHPSITILTTLPAAVAPSQAQCALASGSFDFEADGLAHNDTIVFRVGITADELSGVVKTTDLVFGNAESDFQFFSSTTFDFEGGTDGWTVIQGTFNRTNATHSSFYEASSDNLPDQCDHIRSPVVRLSSTSTLSLQNRFDIEPLFPQGQVFYDRANIGLFDTTDGSRTVVSPDGGRTYNASGPNGTCGTTGQPGFADAATTFAGSSWSSAALGSAAFSGIPVQLDVRYGTDPVAQGFGFHFDDVTLTDVDLQVPDGQSDSCVPAVCGNGVREGAEECDGADLGGASCSDIACASGSVACNVDCTLDFSACADCSVCGNGTCEAGEDCLSCAADCPSFDVSGASCGNGLCEAGDGEDCVTCPADCNGQQGGKPSGRFCCGFGGDSPVGCGDSACITGGFMCTEVPVGAGATTCCGDLTCESPEDGNNCALDCGAPPSCGDGTCDPGEDSCSCAADCGAPPTNEVGLCGDGVDNDCDGLIDCADPDCDPVCNVDCSVFTDKNSCNAQPTCNWNNKDKVCLPV